MKQKKLSSLLALSISMELMLSPLPALAQQPTTEQKIMNTFEMGKRLYDTIRGAQNGQFPPHVHNDMQAFRSQQTPMPDKHFTWANMQRIPGLAEYIAKKNQEGAGINPAQFNCNNLPTTIHDAKNEVCRMEKVSKYNPAGLKAQADEAFAYYNQYEQIRKLYSNYSVNSHGQSQQYGVGCMKRAMNILQGFFKYRLEQMDIVTATMEAKIAAFEKDAASQAAINTIKETTAFLNGEDSQFASEFKDKDLFNYAKALDGQACASIFSENSVNSLGKASGLKAIEKKLNDEFSTPVGRYSPAQYIEKHASVMKDIQDMASKVAKHAKNNFSSIASSQEGYSSFLKTLATDVGSETGVHSALGPGFFTDLQGKFVEKRNALTKEVNLIRSELGDNPAYSQLMDVDDDETFDAEITSLENQIKGRCVANNAGIDSALARINDSTVSSKTANKASTAQIKKRISEIIKDIKLSPEKKLAELKELEGKFGGRYEIKMDADYQTEVLEAGKMVKKTVNAASKVTPSSYFSDIVRNCESQFQVNKLNNKLTGKEAIKRLRTLKKEYAKAARQHQDDIRKEIVNKMVECGGKPEVQNSIGTASCSPDKLNMSSPNFCAKAAFSCSRNMQACTEKAKNLMKQKQDLRLAKKNEYNANVDKIQASMVGIFDNAMTKFIREGELLRGMFNEGFAAPQDIARDLEGDAKYNREFLGEDPIKVKDPKAYLEMMKKNMAKLKKSIQEQQEQIVGGPLTKPTGLLADHVKLIEDNYLNEVIKPAEKLARSCHNAYVKYDQMVEAENDRLAQMQGELGEKKAEFCTRYNTVFSTNPSAACKDGIGELASSTIKAAEKAGQPSDAIEARRLHQQMVYHCGIVLSEKEKEEGKVKKTPGEVCDEALANESGVLFQKLVARTQYYKGLKESKDSNKDKVLALCGLASGDGSYMELVCGSKKVVIAGSNGSQSSQGEETIDCTEKVSEAVVGAYTGTPGVSVASTQAQPDHSSMCNGSNDSGPHNFKGGFPQYTDPMAGQPGGRNVMGL